MIFTILNISEVRQIIVQYGIDQIIGYKELSGGSQNSNYLVSTDTGDFVLAICEQSEMQEINDLALLLEHLETNYFPTSKLVRTTNGSTCSEWKNKPVMLKQFIPGISKEEIDANHIYLIGKELAHLHNIPAPQYLQASISYGIDFFGDVDKYSSGSQFSSWLKNMEEYIKPYLSRTLPKALIHSDVFSNNVVISPDGESVTIMDFEEAANYYRLFDIGMTFVGACRTKGEIDFNKSKALLKGYLSINKLSNEEVRSLKAFTVYAATAMTFWRHRNFNFINPTPELSEHYKALQDIAELVYKMEEQDFKNKIEL